MINNQKLEQPVRQDNAESLHPTNVPVDNSIITNSLKRNTKKRFFATEAIKKINRAEEESAKISKALEADKKNADKIEQEINAIKNKQEDIKKEAEAQQNQLLEAQKKLQETTQITRDIELRSLMLKNRNTQAEAIVNKTFDINNNLEKDKKLNGTIFRNVLLTNQEIIKRLNIDQEKTAITKVAHDLSIIWRRYVNESGFINNIRSYIVNYNPIALYYCNKYQYFSPIINIEKLPLSPTQKNEIKRMKLDYEDLFKDLVKKHKGENISANDQKSQQRQYQESEQLKEKCRAAIENKLNSFLLPNLLGPDVEKICTKHLI